MLTPDLLIGACVTLLVVLLVRSAMFGRWIPQPMTVCPECVKKQAVIDQIMAEMMETHGTIRDQTSEIARLRTINNEQATTLAIYRRGGKLDN